MFTPSTSRVALVYDWVDTPFGGAERVLTALHHIFPTAPLYTSVYNPHTAPWAQMFEIHTTFLQSIPLLRRFHRLLLPLLPGAFKRFDFSAYDIVISVSSAHAKDIITKPPSLHICYLLTPPRYLWSHTLDYQQGLLKPVKAYVFSKLRKTDYWNAQNIDAVIPISNMVKKRVEKYYKRTTHPVIYPPLLPLPEPTTPVVLPPNFQDFYLIVARLVEYKKVLEAVQACIELNQNVVIVGNGHQATKLKQLIKSQHAQTNVAWYPNLSDQSVGWLYSKCTGFLLPAEEDFGITALEAQAYGKPVLIYKKSGAAEIVIDGQTGLFMDTQTIAEIKKTIQECNRRKWQSSSIKKHAQLYNEENFSKQLTHAITDIVRTHTKSTERAI